MLSWKVLNSMLITKFCKGSIVSARVYADVKGGKCPCGGLFTKRVPYKPDSLLILPVCESCSKEPSHYVIDATAKDHNGKKIKVRIRNTKDSERLDSRENVAYIIKVIQKEILDGNFNIRHYDSEKSKEAFIFKNYVIEYLEHQKRRLARGEITPKGLLDKEGLIRRELLPFFGKWELFRINTAMINKFRDGYTTKLRTRDLATSELKALLNQACRDELLVTAPKFEPIPRSKQREEIISLELAKQTVELITKEIYRDMYSLLLTYPIRPGELRALSWEDVDFNRGKFLIRQHFSGGELIQGRKSVKAGKKEARLWFDMSRDARAIFAKYRSASLVSLSSFVFLSHSGKHVSEDALWEAWKVARDKLGHKYAPYECRHVATSELYINTGHDLLRTKEVGGWTNTTTLERYARDRSDNSDLFN